jgi:hypothetical protein
MPGVDDIDDEDEFGGARHTRHFEDLDPQEQEALRNIKSSQDIQSCQIVNDWIDDHVVCVGVILNNVEFGAWWCGWEVAGAFKYWQAPEAKQEILKYLAWQLENNEPAPDLNPPDDDSDEITPEDLPQRPQ